MQLRHFIKLGIPDDMRGKVWNKMIGSQAIKVISSFDYQVNIMIINSEKRIGEGLCCMKEKSDVFYLFAYFFTYNFLSVQACLTEIRQLLVDLGVSEYGGANCVSRLGQIVGREENTNSLMCSSRKYILPPHKFKEMYEV